MNALEALNAIEDDIRRKSLTEEEAMEILSEVGCRDAVKLCKVNGSCDYALLLEESRLTKGFKIHRVISLVDYEDKIHKGDIGGWVDVRAKLDPRNGGWIYDDAIAIGGVVISGEVRDNAICCAAKPDGSRCVIKVQGLVDGKSKILGSCVIDADSGVHGESIVKGNNTICMSSRVIDSTISGSIEVAYINVENAKLYGTGSTRKQTGNLKNKTFKVSGCSVKTE